MRYLLASPFIYIQQYIMVHIIQYDTIYESSYIDFSHRQLSCYTALFWQRSYKLLYILNAYKII